MGGFPNVRQHQTRFYAAPPERWEQERQERQINQQTRLIWSPGHQALTGTEALSLSLSLSLYLSFFPLSLCLSSSFSVYITHAAVTLCMIPVLQAQTVEWKSKRIENKYIFYLCVCALPFLERASWGSGCRYHTRSSRTPSLNTDVDWLLQNTLQPFISHNPEGPSEFKRHWCSDLCQSLSVRGEAAAAAVEWRWAGSASRVGIGDAPLWQSYR